MPPRFKRCSLRRIANQYHFSRSPRVRLMLEPLEARTAPAVLTVTDGGDSGGAAQLRQIWALANSNGEADTITVASSVANVILVGAALSDYSENSDLTIQGNGSGATTIHAPPGQRLFNFSYNGDFGTSINILGITLTGA